MLHVQCFSGNGAYATALSIVGRIPLVVTLQGETLMDDHDIYDHSVTLRAALRLGLRRAAAVTACSESVLEDAQSRFNLDRAKADVIFNGVDVDHLDPLPVGLRFPRYVLGVGRIVRKKGFDLLLDAFARVATAYPDVGLVIAGGGPAASELSQRSTDLGLDGKVQQVGPLGRAEILHVMQNAELLVVPSRFEPFGIVVLEGWAGGIPVVVTSRGGPSEFVRHGESGLVADPFDTDALASAIGSLLASPGFRQRLAEEGRTRPARLPLGTHHRTLRVRVPEGMRRLSGRLPMRAELKALVDWPLSLRPPVPRRTPPFRAYCVERRANADVVNALAAQARDLHRWSLDVGAGMKFDLLARLVAQHPPRSSEEWLVFLDDDVTIVRGTLATFIGIAAALAFDVAQPGHDRRGYVNYGLTVSGSLGRG